ncbi:aminotransferase class V-fold PLP-dependent enzyme [Nonomuraea sp. NPDC050310]|uniref:aminotransferase class V-fold PLP-dependent enzyme n=1 Tax=Nonomuraea sp. NPDC050310 TaxID=3154935 RepID=UPI0033C86E1A
MTQSLNRRAVLGAGLLAPLSACTSTSAAPAASAPAAPAPGDWESVAAQFALKPGVANFAAYVLAPHPAPVRRAIQQHRDALDADPHYTPAGGMVPDDASRKAAADYLGARFPDIALTDSTTMGLGLLYSGLRLRPGHEVLTTEHDFMATHENLRLLAARTGAKVRRVRLYDDPFTASADRVLAAIKAGLSPATRVVAVTWVHSSTGVRLPIRAIADLLAAENQSRNANDRMLLCVDGVHGFGAMADGVEELGCDFLASGTHKWLAGPRGTGILWGRDWSRLDPVITSFGPNAFESWQTGRPPAAPTADYYTPGGYKAFEHRWAMPAAFEFHQALGKQRVQARIQELATRLKAGLKDLRHVKLATPLAPELSAGLVCCSVEGLSPGAAVTRLRERHRIETSVTPYREQLLRFGTTIMNSPEQVDQAIKAMASLA